MKPDTTIGRRLMSKQRPAFLPEFKLQDARWFLDKSNRHIETSRSACVAKSVWRRWINQPPHTCTQASTTSGSSRVPRSRVISSSAAAMPRLLR